MTTITLEVPDEVAKQLDPLRPRLPALLLTAIELADTEHLSPSVFPDKHLLLEETVDLFTSRPTPAQVLAFKFSPEAQDRLQELEDKNREETLDADERAEMELYSQINHLMILIKARTRQTYSNAN